MPFLLFSAAILASLERTPLTGRWRMILLSPHEEDEISSQLAGSGWYQAVGEVIAKDGPVKLIPPSDWRFAWVRDTLRHLETAIPLLADEASLGSTWLERGPDDIPLPPPTDYPLRARPTETEMLRWCSQIVCHHSASTVVAPISPHRIPGPPYSLIVVDDPDSCNAFSFGFGPDGAGGIVVYSGFLDSILRTVPAAELRMRSASEPGSEEASWWSYLFGSIATVHPPVQRYHPTREQTSELAMLLAHELSHLVLAHHIENLSSRMIVLPGTLSLLGDVLRAVLFPFTMIFGPFVNDAVAEMGSAINIEQIAKLGEFCTTRTQEIEADVVSARLLAHAGFDARRAVDFWERKHSVDSELMECTPSTPRRTHSDSLAMRLVGSGHPVQDLRMQKLREELNRWREERTAARAALADQAQQEQAAAAAS
ncbi:hypothetical protein EWM64_g725 [Hericium alpestre]|uniref:Peptidase M48 domain-containing protein n=1 Tax=Hericium alpestre TaxID=135208 RepID=A0A4Z0A9A4_9AGAM|nr:hypothetical protein EWM64_g725 [Hericium alpestre]